jgi:transposase InsO family protein
VSCGGRTRSGGRGGWCLRWAAAAIVTGLDDHSRFCVIAKAVTRATARPVCQAFADAMRVYGVPEEVLTDNGKVFTGRFHKPGVPVEVLFDKICRENGITHQLTKIHSSTTTGKVVRLNSRRCAMASPMRGLPALAGPAMRDRCRHIVPRLRNRGRDA